MGSENTEYRPAPCSSPAAKHALVIEDFPIIAMSIGDELAEMGFSTAVAATEAEAVALAEERCPDLIIADLRLAQGCGIEAVRHICGERPMMRSTSRLSSTGTSPNSAGTRLIRPACRAHRQARTSTRSITSTKPTPCCRWTRTS